MGPESASSAAFEQINTLYWVMLVVVAILFVAANLGLWAALRRKPAEGRRRQRRGAGRIVAAGLGVLATAIFVLGVVYTERTEDEATASVGSAGTPGEQGGAALAGLNGEGVLKVQAVGQQWLWRYQYPGGTFSYYELVLPVGVPTRVDVESTDVLHSWSVPGLAPRTDAVPGRPHTVRFTPTKEGTFEGASYQYSGANFATMRTVVRVVSPAAYERWLRKQGDEIASAQAWVEREIADNGPYGAIELKAAGGGG